MGFIYDSLAITIELPAQKKEKVRNQIQRFSTGTRCSIRDFARMVGTLGSCCAALKYGWAHMKNFEREKFMALQRNKGNYEAVMEVSNEIKEDLDWWMSHVANAKCSIQIFEPGLEIFSEISRWRYASLSGWGSFCQGQQTHGY